MTPPTDFDPLDVDEIVAAKTCIVIAMTRHAEEMETELLMDSISAWNALEYQHAALEGRPRTNVTGEEIREL